MSDPNNPASPSGEDADRALDDVTDPAAPADVARDGDDAAQPDAPGDVAPSDGVVAPAPPQPATRSGVAARLERALEGVDLNDEPTSPPFGLGAPLAGPAPAPPRAAAPVEPLDLPGPDLSAAARREPMRAFDFDALSDWHLRASIVVVFALLYFVRLGSFGLWDPWEVHYGAVGWGHVERQDWISPWWGSYWAMPGKGMVEGEYFFSKPILLLWMMGMGIQVFGVDQLEWGIRFGTALIALLGVGAVYMAGERIWSRKVGVLMAVAMGTSPFYAMLARQAQTDMPYVGLMTVALSFFMMGVFGRDRSRKADKLSWAVFALFTLAVVVPQLHTITVGQLTWRYAPSADWSFARKVQGIAEAVICYGPVQLGIYVALIATFIVTQIRQDKTSRGQLYLYVFYAFIALATMGKGLLGFGVPGAIIFLYLVITREWGLLRRVELFRGVIVTVVVGLPWYGAVMARHGGIGGSWWQRFIIHDHFKRLATGVHQIDTGSFEHFIKWLGYGLFPWGAFVPAIIARALSGDAASTRTDQDRARLFLFIWFAFAFTLFTVSSTKFHHYIFPAVPALAMLAALLLDDLHEGRIQFGTWWPMFVGAGVMFALIGFDLVTDTTHLKNMFTYRYDRNWVATDWDVNVRDDAGRIVQYGFKPALALFVALGGLGLLLVSHPHRRRAITAGIATLAVTGLLTATWALNVYMPRISSTWSQKGVWDTYYSLCTPGEPPRGTHPMKRDRYCVDSVISYKLNWRGETFYTLNEVIPVPDDDAWRYFIGQNGDRCFYAVMERSRMTAFRNALPAERRDTVHLEHDGNMKFVLMSANCRAPEEAQPEAAPAAEPPPDDGVQN